jgi:hypothetical protein
MSEHVTGLKIGSSEELTDGSHSGFWIFKPDTYGLWDI